MATNWKQWENAIKTEAQMLLHLKRARIERITPPVVSTGKSEDGSLKSYSIKGSTSVDFSGHIICHPLRGVRVEFDAKYTDNDKGFKISSISDGQLDRLSSFAAEGPITFIYLATGPKRFVLPVDLYADVAGRSHKRTKRGRGQATPPVSVIPWEEILGSEYQVKPNETWLQRVLELQVVKKNMVL